MILYVLLVTVWVSNVDVMVSATQTSSETDCVWQRRLMAALLAERPEPFDVRCVKIDVGATDDDTS